MPAHHDVRASDVLSSRLHATFKAAANRGAADFAELLLVPGVGARTVRALAMVAEVVHGAPYRFTDPARFSFAHGGKDRHPFPVPLKVYDETIGVMKAAVQKAKLGQDDRLAALKRLDDEARRVERRAAGPTVPEVIAEELRLSHSYRGRSVFGWEPAPNAFPPSGSREQRPIGDRNVRQFVRITRKRGREVATNLILRRPLRKQRAREGCFRSRSRPCLRLLECRRFEAGAPQDKAVDVRMVTIGDLSPAFHRHPDSETGKNRPHQPALDQRP